MISAAAARRATASALTFSYVFSSLALSGIPGWSSLSLYSFLALLAFVVGFAAAGRIAIGEWVIAPALFVALCIAFGVFAPEPAVDTLKTLGVAWGGGVCVALVVEKIVSIRVVVVAMIVAAAANSVAIGLGFDAYARYVADFREVSEQALLRRPSGLVGNSNVVAVQAWLAVLATIIWYRSCSRWLLLTSLLCAVHALVETGSRKVVLLAFCAFLIAMTRFGRSMRSRTIIFMSFAAAGGFAVLWLTTSSQTVQTFRDVEVVDRIYRAIEGTDVSFEDRYRFIGAGLELILERPFLGYGLDMFRYVSGTGLYSHNNYIELAISGGLLLLLSYYSVHVFALTRVHHTQKLSVRDKWTIAASLLSLMALDFTMVSYETKIVPLMLLLLAARVGFAYPDPASPFRRLSAKENE